MSCVLASRRGVFFSALGLPAGAGCRALDLRPPGLRAPHVHVATGPRGLLRSERLPYCPGS